MSWHRKVVLYHKIVVIVWCMDIVVSITGHCCRDICVKIKIQLNGVGDIFLTIHTMWEMDFMTIRGF